MTETTNDPAAVDSSKSALQDNIDRMGKNAYYFAHAHKATGPKWDGKIEPRLLSSSSSLTASGDVNGGSAEGGVATTVSVTTSDAAKALASRSISMNQSNITNYAFMDEGSKIKIYVNLPGVGNMNMENISLESSARSLCLTVREYVVPRVAEEKEGASDDDLVCDTSGDVTNEDTESSKQSQTEDRCLSFAQLYGEIESATFKKKQDKIIVILKKKDESAWSSVIA